MSRRVRLLFVVAFVAVTPAPVLGQGLVGRSKPAEIGFQYIGLNRGRDGRGQTTDDSFREWISVPLQGSIVDTRILSWNLNLRPTFSQRKSGGLPDALNSREFGYRFAARALSAKPLSISFSANAASGSTSGGLGSEGEFETSNRSLDLLYQNPLLPLRLGYRTFARRNQWSTPGVQEPIEWSNSDRTLHLLGEGRKTRINIQKMDFEDRLGPNDFSLFNAAVTHTLRWGKGSLLRSRWDRTDREGSIESNRRTWRESLTIRHTKGTTSNYSYRDSRAETPTGETNIRNWGAGLRSSITTWLSASGRYGSTQTRFNGSIDEVRSWAPQVDVNVPLGRRGRVTLGGSLGREHRLRQGVPGGLVDILDEPHTIDATRAFRLEQPGAEARSIVVERQDRTLLFAEGVDYEVLALEDVVEIIIPAGSRIQEGETVLVSYRFMFEELPSGDLTTERFYGSISLLGITASHNESRRRTSDTGSEAGFGLGLSDESSSSIRGRWQLWTAVFDVGARRRERNSTTFDFETEEADANLTLPLWASALLTAGASARRAMDQTGAVDSRTVNVSLAWPFTEAVSFYGRAQTLEYEFEQGALTRSFGATADLTIRHGTTRILLRYQRDRQSDPVDFRGSRFFVRVTRQF